MITLINHLARRKIKHQERKKLRAEVKKANAQHHKLHGVIVTNQSQYSRTEFRIAVRGARKSTPVHDIFKEYLAAGGTKTRGAFYPLVRKIKNILEENDAK